MSRLSELAAQFAELVKRKERVETEDKDIKVQISRIEEQLIEAMADEGVQNFKLMDGPTLYRRVDRFYGPAEGVSKEELISVLAAYPQTMDLVSPNYNTNSLRARMKEIEANGEQIPEELVSKLNVFEKHKIGYR
jgi:hypothetical protein